MSDLVERLREGIVAEVVDQIPAKLFQRLVDDRYDAADRIEALEKALNAATIEVDHYDELTIKQTTRIEVLEGALEEISNPVGFQRQDGWAASVARAALHHRVIG